MYGRVEKPHSRPKGDIFRLHDAAVKGLLEFQRQHPWAYQDEMARFIEEEWDITVSPSTICRYLKRHRISRKRGLEPYLTID